MMMMLEIVEMCYGPQVLLLLRSGWAEGFVVSLLIGEFKT